MKGDQRLEGMNEDGGNDQVAIAASALWRAIEATQVGPTEAVEALTLCLYNICSYNNITFEQMRGTVIGTWQSMDLASLQSKGTSV